MGWRSVIGAWVVCLVLGLAYRRLEPVATSAFPVGEPPPRSSFLGVEPGHLREMRLMRQGRVLAARRGDDGWVVVEPSGADVPAGLVSAMADALTAAEVIEEIATPDADLQAYGLADGAGRIDVVGDDRGAIGIEIGALNPSGTAVYARRRDVPGIVLIGRTIRYYEDLLLRALPTPAVPTGSEGAVGR